MLPLLFLYFLILTFAKIFLIYEQILTIQHVDFYTYIYRMFLSIEILLKKSLQMCSVSLLMVYEDIEVLCVLYSTLSSVSILEIHGCHTYFFFFLCVLVLSQACRQCCHKLASSMLARGFAPGNGDAANPFVVQGQPRIAVPGNT